MQRNTHMPSEAVGLYRDLSDFLSFLIEDGLLDESDLGDNYHPIRNILMEIAAADPGEQKPPESIISQFDYELCDECGEPADNGEGWNGLRGNCADRADA